LIGGCFGRSRASSTPSPLRPGAWAKWFRRFVRERSGRRLGADDLRELEPLNRLLGRDEQFAQIVGEPTGGETVLGLKALRRWEPRLTRRFSA
jgi:hypothetical protein